MEETGTLAIFNLGGIHFVLRWLHVFFGVIWIGHLYYFNFVQGAFFNETDAPTKSNAIQKLVPRALWWFRWGAMWTFVTGVCMLALQTHLEGHQTFQNAGGAMILIGAIMGTIMWANVWFVIWPKQKIVIKNAEQTAKGGAAIAEAAAAGARALVASRTNTLLSIPMLFFMLARWHLPVAAGSEASFGGLFLSVLILLGIVEANALFGKTGPMTTVKGVVTSGFALTAVVYALIEICL